MLFGNEMQGQNGKKMPKGQGWKKRGSMVK